VNRNMSDSKKRDFLTANIDRAIVMTQHDLRGFHGPLGRMKYMESAKCLDATTGNFMACAAGCGNDSNPTDKNHANYMESSFEEYLAMCIRLANDCDDSQKEAIQLIVQKIVEQSNEMKAEVTAGSREVSSYLVPLEKGFRWGKAVLALAKAFEVKLEQMAT